MIYLHIHHFNLPTSISLGRSFVFDWDSGDKELNPNINSIINTCTSLSEEEAAYKSDIIIYPTNEDIQKLEKIANQTCSDFNTQFQDKVSILRVKIASTWISALFTMASPISSISERLAYFSGIEAKEKIKVPGFSVWSSQGMEIQSLCVMNCHRMRL